MLLLFECFVASRERAGKLPLVAFHMPVKLALGDELAIDADRALKL